MQYGTELRRFMDWRIAGLLLWGAVGLVLMNIARLGGSYVLAVIAYPFGLDFSEGLIWQQAEWVPGPHMYGDIGQLPFVGFEYPPLYHIATRLFARVAGLDMLHAGRIVAAAATLALCLLLGLCVRETTRRSGNTVSWAAGAFAALLPASFLPILAWAPLMRVDMLACAFTYAGILAGLAALRRPRLLYGAMLCFVAACYTKQTFLAAPTAMLAIHLLRDPRHTIRAAACGCIAGLALLVLLSWQTQGGFLHHVLGENVNRFSLPVALHHIGLWLTGYMPAMLAVLLSVILAWRTIAARPSFLQKGLLAFRTDPAASATAFLTLYLALAFPMLLLVGKSGASMNYFIEFFCLCCVWLGRLAAAMAEPAQAGPLPACSAVLLLLQLWPIPTQIARMHAEQLAPDRASQAQALLDRVRGLAGPILSDDMVLVKQAGKDVEIEPAIIAELAHRGAWDERRLIAMLLSHHYGAVVTAYGPGNATFDSRYLPATQAAMLKAYPLVVTYGDFRLRLPSSG